jgi:hypothetical protein
VASGEALVPVMALVASVMTGGPAPSHELAQEAPVRWHDGDSLDGNGG